MGVCGKQPDTAYLQDLLIYCLQGLSTYAKEALRENRLDNKVKRFTVEALFATLTNVN
ncbi:MAG: hydroxylamine reductase, partial [Thermodesulfovibrio sp.]